MRYPADPDPPVALPPRVLVRAPARSVPRRLELPVPAPTEILAAYRDWRLRASPTLNLHRWPRWQRVTFLLLFAGLGWAAVVGAVMAEWWLVFLVITVLLVL